MISEEIVRQGADTFRIVTGDGYGAFGVVDKGNITVEGGGLLEAVTRQTEG